MYILNTLYLYEFYDIICEMDQNITDYVFFLIAKM